VDLFQGFIIGISANQFDELEQHEVIEFRREAVNLCKEIVERREDSKECHAMYAYAAQVMKTSQVLYQMFSGGMVILSVWVDADRTVTVKVAIEANADTVIKETIESTYRKRRRPDRDIPSYTNYVLKICARHEYLLGSYPISQYKVSLQILNFHRLLNVLSAFLLVVYI